MWILAGVKQLFVVVCIAGRGSSELTFELLYRLDRSVP